jgi:hypothetical protein
MDDLVAEFIVETNESLGQIDNDLVTSSGSRNYWESFSTGSHNKRDMWFFRVKSFGKTCPPW